MSEQASGPSIPSALLCEDIRQEKHNKLSLVGVYLGRTIVVPEFPAHLRSLFFLWVVEGLPEGHVESTHRVIRADADEEEVVFRSLASVESKKGIPAVIAVGYGGLKFTEASRYVSVFQLEHGDVPPFTHTLEFGVDANPDMFDFD